MRHLMSIPFIFTIETFLAFVFTFRKTAIQFVLRVFPHVPCEIVAAREGLKTDEAEDAGEN